MPHRVFARDVQSSRACSSYVAASFRRLDRADDWRGSITARMVRSVCSAAAARSSRGPTALVLTALVLRHGKAGRQWHSSAICTTHRFLDTHTVVHPAVQMVAETALEISAQFSDGVCTYLSLCTELLIVGTAPPPSSTQWFVVAGNGSGSGMYALSAPGVQRTDEARREHYCRERAVRARDRCRGYIPYI